MVGFSPSMYIEVIQLPHLVFSKLCKEMLYYSLK